MEAVWILLGAVAVTIIVLWARGKAAGAPEPSSLSNAALDARINSEMKWLQRYDSLPLSHQQGKLKEQHDEKNVYLQKLFMERKQRMELVQTKMRAESEFADRVRVEQDVLAEMADVEPERIISRINELVSEGTPQDEAKRKALSESQARVKERIEERISSL
ncbi:hypothetical protein [Halomonas sp. PGE1]|uniref:hypothetical protein n=1 Tax=Halomonas sp. PGE1 TaxID=2730360 RepID=UPI00147560DA|nr:hypothetical protein [Halomonas sp. PGE1]QJR00146.1 hypothetical protein HIR79_16770 [Halomonas sp. PGE1]